MTLCHCAPISVSDGKNRGCGPMTQIVMRIPDPHLELIAWSTFGIGKIREQVESRTHSISSGIGEKWEGE